MRNPVLLLLLRVKEERILIRKTGARFFPSLPLIPFSIRVRTLPPPHVWTHSLCMPSLPGRSTCRAVRYQCLPCDNTAAAAVAAAAAAGVVRGGKALAKGGEGAQLRPYSQAVENELTHTGRGLEVVKKEWHYKQQNQQKTEEEEGNQ